MSVKLVRRNATEAVLRNTATQTLKTQYCPFCALQKSAAIFLMLKNPVGLTALCNPFASAMSLVKRLFMYLVY